MPAKKTGRGISGVPARELTGGELEVAREHEEVKARRGVGLVRTGVAGWVFSHGEVRRWLGLLAGGRAAAVGWGCGEVWKLRDARVELKVGSAWAEGVWRSGPAAASGSLELRRRAVVLGVPGARDLWVRGAEWKDEDEAKIVRMLEKGKPGSSPSCHSGGEVAAAELAGAAWRGEQGSSAGWSGSRGSRGRRVWQWAKQEVASRDS